MKKVYGYIRVSTVKQGNGVSLQEQKEAIIRHAEKNQLEIVRWFEELETAAKQGRPLFTQMMKLLQSKKASGVIIHKIDRSARNLRDWASLGDLIDQGIEVHFAHESLDMTARGGRLAADIQAVIASDYIRNLRDETLKGMYGRLKQGIYPWNAPPGYINNGGGQLKTIDKFQGAIIKRAFELYATGNFSIEKLTVTVNDLGLKNTWGNKITMNTLSALLQNPFYVGIMKINGNIYQGLHEPLITTKLFTQVQNTLKGKSNSKLIKHDFLYRRFIKCEECKYSLIAESQKGHIYYRCQTKGCPTKTIREEIINKIMLNTLDTIQIPTIESSILDDLLKQTEKEWVESHTGIASSLKMQQSKILEKLERLTDAFLEQIIDKDIFNHKKEKLLLELQSIKNTIEKLPGQKEAVIKKAKEFLELTISLKKSFVNAIPEEKRRILKIVTSNFAVTGRKLNITMRPPFSEISNVSNFLISAPTQGTPRTCTANYAESDGKLQPAVDSPELMERMKKLLDIVLEYCQANPEPYDI